jgi:hypothetical protein
MLAKIEKLLVEGNVVMISGHIDREETSNNNRVIVDKMTKIELCAEVAKPINKWKAKEYNVILNHLDKNVVYNIERLVSKDKIGTSKLIYLLASINGKEYELVKMGGLYINTNEAMDELSKIATIKARGV